MGVYRYWEVLKEVSSKNKEYLMKIGFFNWKYVLGGGLNKTIFVSNYQYLVKLRYYLISHERRHYELVSLSEYPVTYMKTSLNT